MGSYPGRRGSTMTSAPLLRAPRRRACAADPAFESRAAGPAADVSGSRGLSSLARARVSSARPWCKSTARSTPVPAAPRTQKTFFTEDVVPRDPTGRSAQTVRSAYEGCWERCFDCRADTSLPPGVRPRWRRRSTSTQLSPSRVVAGGNSCSGPCSAWEAQLVPRAGQCDASHSRPHVGRRRGPSGVAPWPGRLATLGGCSGSRGRSSSGRTRPSPSAGGRSCPGRWPGGDPRPPPS